ncbi:hypothetical protein EDC04DRAFT_2897910 [Pisolithus marmoratus]|nr:hypothetical protein EDC04DRAFT_2897910 [Pisolithus marmoratus]
MSGKQPSRVPEVYKGTGCLPSFCVLHPITFSSSLTGLFNVPTQSLPDRLQAILFIPSFLSCESRCVPRSLFLSCSSRPPLLPFWCSHYGKQASAPKGSGSGSGSSEVKGVGAPPTAATQPVHPEPGLGTSVPSKREWDWTPPIPSPPPSHRAGGP